MTRRVRAALALLVVASVVAGMLRLSLWQWDRARATGRLLNWSYAVEWLVFAVLTVVGVLRLALEDRRRAAGARVAEPDHAGPATPGAQVPVIGPPLRPGEELEELTWVRLRRRLGTGGRER